MRTGSGLSERCWTASIRSSRSTNAPTRMAFATVPTRIRTSSLRATARISSETAMFAAPNESGVWFAMPWFSTSHGDSPSSDS